MLPLESGLCPRPLCRIPGTGEDYDDFDVQGVGAGVAASAQYSTPVRDVENPARTAAQFKLSCTKAQLSCSTDFAIPSGMRLVVKYVTATGLYKDSFPLSLVIGSTLDGVYLMHEIPMNLKWNDASGHRFAVAAPTRIYADAFIAILDGVFLDLSSNSRITVSGYLVKK